MSNPTLRRLALLTAANLLSASASTAAENIDPAAEQAQYAWSETAGWQNAEPLGEGGPGMEVGAAELTGWIWGENVGWISLSCKNRDTCATVDYGVKHDGAGSLSGFAWGQNVGWINFAPRIDGTPVPVRIHTTNGVFSGLAWAENLGWVSFGTFSEPAVSAFQVTTSWRAPGPTATPTPTGAGSLATTTATPTPTGMRISTPTPTRTPAPTVPATDPAGNLVLSLLLLAAVIALLKDRARSAAEKPFS